MDDLKSRFNLDKLPIYLYSKIESSPDIDNSGGLKIKVQVPIELTIRINDMIDLLNILSKSKIIRSAIALEKGNEEKRDNG